MLQVDRCEVIHKMSTLLQEKLADALIENAHSPDPMNKQELLVYSGYSPSSAETQPLKIIDQKGVQNALFHRGFTIEGATKVVQSIMYNEEEKGSTRLQATDQVFKVHGAYKPQTDVSLQFVNIDL